MKVTILNTTDRIGGAAIAAFRLFKALQAAGVSSGMLVRDSVTSESGLESRDHGFFRKWINFFRFVAERIYFLPFERSKEVRFSFSIANTGENISRLNIVRNADILHLHWINQGFLSLKDLRKIIATGKPLVWTLHDSWAFTGGCHLTGDCQRFMLECGYCPFLRHPHDGDLSYRLLLKKKKLYNRANITFIGCSDWMALRAAKSTLLKGFRIESIPNPIDTGLFNPGDQEKAREELGLPRDRFLILCGAANLKDPKKGFHQLIEAINLLSKRIPGFNDSAALVTFGKTDEQMAAGIPIIPVRYLEDETKVVALYQACNVFVNPSLQENLPNTIMESMSCGLPVVAFKTGGIPEMITHRKTGYLAALGDPVDLSRGIEWMYTFTDRKSLGRNCREKVLQDYSYEIVAQKYRSLYESILNHES